MWIIAKKYPIVDMFVKNEDDLQMCECLLGKNIEAFWQ